MLNKALIVIFLLCSQMLYGRQSYSVSGYIRDAKNGEALIGAVIQVKETGAGIATNVYGFYAITLPAGDYTLVYSYVGYANLEKKVTLSSNQKLDIELSENKTELNEVVVTSERPDVNIKGTQMSVNKLDMKEISKIPALLGEVDLVRSIQLLPGVSTVGEGATGFNVRGGSIDQNLILLDEAPVYNSSHLFGFFSIFNPDAVKDVTLYKGGIPAQYGGRLSSVLDVRLKEGNNKRLSVKGGTGIIFSRLTIEGPIKKDKGSFIIAGRRSYADVLAAPFLAGNADFKGLKLYFYDLTLKANYNLTAKDRVYVSGYLGRDVFGVSTFGFNWGNTTLTTRWNHLFSNKLFMNMTAYYSNYDYQLGATTNSSSGDGFNWNSSIVNYSIKPEFTWYLNNRNTVSVGAQSIYYTFKPGTATFTSSGQSSITTLPDKYALENAVYASNEQKISEKFTLTYGLRFSQFSYLGKGVKQTYGPSNGASAPRELLSTDTINSLKVIQQYSVPEPRFALKYEVNQKSSIKFSYMRTAQYVHLISNTAASIPLDVWTPSTNNIKPQIGDQVALGYFRNFGSSGSNDYETSVEGFYKNMQNQLDYINGADLLLNPQLEGQLLSGKGRAYGIELYIKKNTGKLTGWISYTLSRTERLTNGVNNNDWYPSRFDKTHNLNIVGSYQVSKRWSINSNVIYGTGTPVNLPTNKFYYEGYAIPENPGSPRNNIRIPAYFRIDVTATLKSNRSAYKIAEEEMPKNFFKAMKYRYEWDLVFGFYNILARKNAFAIYPQTVSQNSTATQLVQFSLFGFAIPALTYNFRF